MKGSKWYIVFILLLLALMITLEYNMPRNFIWSPTFSQYDKQPFGAAIFDDVVSASIPEGYTVTDKTLYQLEQDSITGTAILIVEDHLNLSKVDTESLFNLLNQGNKVMLVSENFGYTLADSLKMSVYRSYFSARSLKNYASGGNTRDTIYWKQDSVFNAMEFYVYPHFLWSYFSESDSLAVELAYKKTEDYVFIDEADDNELDEDEEEYDGAKLDSALIDSINYYPGAVRTTNALALRFQLGKGELYLVSTPLLFTNYGMLDSNNSLYIFRLLSYMKGMPLIRTEGYGNVYDEPSTPLRYFLSQPPLRWGIYLTMILIVLFMVFTAKRRQRVIPVIRKPENKSVEFVELIGTLYYQKKDHGDLVRKKYLFFAETLRRTIQVDLDDGGNDEEHARRIASKTGMDKEDISRLLISLRRVLEDEKAFMTEDLMKMYINRINKITNQL